MTQQMIGQYEIVSVVGDGGMGTVYRGIDPRFGRDVAVKVLHAHFARDPEVVARFKSEAIIQAKLNHPNIASVYDFVTQDALAMIMEFIDGLTLERLIAGTDGHGIPEPRAIAIMSQVLGAVGFAHDKGLIHRDLKPSNIMVQHFGDEEIARVMDFGVAKILGSEKLRTATSAKIGTLAYMSPEHIRSPRAVDARSDVYSLGAVLYEMLTGRLPFDSDSEYELMKQIVDAPPPRPASGLGLRDSTQRALLAALKKNPSERFASCAEFKAALAVAPVAKSTVDRAVSRAIDRAIAMKSAPQPHQEDYRWLIGLEDGEYGPYSASQMKMWLRAGRISRTTLVRTGDSTWSPVKDYSELVQTNPALGQDSRTSAKHPTAPAPPTSLVRGCGFLVVCAAIIWIVAVLLRVGGMGGFFVMALAFGIVFFVWLSNRRGGAR